jgi:protein arginine kinase activator
MKKCRRCSKPATLHITDITDGTVQQIHLCENCASEYLQAPIPPIDEELESILESSLETDPL